MTAPSTSPPVAGGLDVSPLRALALRALLSALDAIPEGKTLLLDASLAGPLGLVADVGALRQHGVERMFWLEEPKEKGSSTKEQMVSAPTRAVVYVCRPDAKWLRVVAGHVAADRAASGSSLAHTYHLLLSPRRTELSLHLLSTLSSSSSTPLLADVHLHDLPLELIPLESDLLSLEDPRAWSRIWRDGDLGGLHETALACMTLQHLWGAFPRIVGKGDAAQRLATLMLRQRREALAADPTNPALTNTSSVVDCLVVLDRTTDLATPLCSQLTYEGLVDEFVGIKSAHVEVDASLLSTTAPGTPGAGGSGAAAPSGSGTPLQMTSAPKQKKHRLDATSDVLFGELRDLNFSVVGEALHRAAQRLTADYEGRHAAQTVAQMRAFVGRLGGLQSHHAGLRLHTSLTERLMAATTTAEFNASLEIQQNIVAGLELPAQLTAIESLVHAEAPLLLVLRLLCLLSVVGGGIKAKALESMTREVLQTYGYEHLPLLLALSKVGLLSRAPASLPRGAPVSGFAAARAPLKLVNDDVDEKQPRDISYVFSGYAPLSVRLVQAVTQKEALLDTAGAGAKRNATAPLPRAHAIVGWKGFEEVLAALPGATVDEEQRSTTTGSSGSASEATRPQSGTASKAASAAAAAAAASASSSSSTPRLPAASTAAVAPGDEAISTTVVLFLGGVTYAEVAALRFMSRQTRTRRFLIATTNMINGDELVRSLGPELGITASAASSPALPAAAPAAAQTAATS